MPRCAGVQRRGKPVSATELYQNAYNNVAVYYYTFNLGPPVSERQFGFPAILVSHDTGQEELER